jgi:hypothetical protein
MTKAEHENRSIAMRPRILLSAYLLHLLVPLAFLLDSLRAMHEGTAWAAEKTLVVIGTMWVLVGLGALAFSRNRRRFLERVSSPLLDVYTLYFSLGLAELGLRIGIRQLNRNPLHFKPGAKMVFHNNRRWPGLSPTVTFSVNELGLRGPMPPHEGRVYKIITVGGSTTECRGLDDSEEWPHLLMQAMNERQKNYSVWVGNAGVAGLTCVDHLAFLRRLPILSQADLLIFLVGANDLQATLDFGGAPTQRVLEYRAKLFEEHAPFGVTPVGGSFRRSWVFALIEEAWRGRGSLLAGMGVHSADKPEPESSESSAPPPRRGTVPLPDLQIGLREYAHRLNSLERECRARGLRCVFLTQPAIWRADLTPAEQRTLWTGKVGRQGHPLGYPRIADLANAMDAYNQILLTACREDHLECYDLASSVPRDTSAFCDDFHFNVGGARIVAQFLAARLLSAPPFR